MTLEEEIRYLRELVDSQNKDLKEFVKELQGTRHARAKLHSRLSELKLWLEHLGTEDVPVTSVHEIVTKIIEEDVTFA